MVLSKKTTPASLPSVLRFVMLTMIGVLFPQATLRAGILYYDFEGSINSTTEFNALLPLDVQVGRHFTGQLSFDDSVPGGPGLGIPNGNLYHFGAVVDLTVHIGSASYSVSNVLSKYPVATQQAVIVGNDVAYQGGLLSDQFEANGFSADYTDPLHHKYTAFAFSLYENSTNPTAITSDSLAGINIDLAKFTSNHTINFIDSDINSFTNSDNARLEFQGTITSLQAQAVPEPSSIFAVAAGLLGIAWRTRKSKMA